MFAHHTLDIYGVEVYAASTPKDWKKVRRRVSFVDKQHPRAAGQSEFAVWTPDTGLTRSHLVLWVDERNHQTVGALVDTIAHEASHAAGQIMAQIGHERRGVDEPHAYLTGWLARFLWDRIVGERVFEPVA